MSSSDDSVEPERLPRVDHNMVPVKDVLGRMVQQAYAELLNLTETLPNADDLNRKTLILAYSTRLRQQFIKLLVLVRWSRGADDMQKIQDVLAYLNQQDSCFSMTADALVGIHNEMKAARDPNYDIPTALEILTTGDYQRLPSIIRKSIIPPSPLTQREIRETLLKTEEIIRMRLMVDEVVPQKFRDNMRIEGGCVTFVVPDEMEVALSLDGSVKSLPWKVVELRILVNWNHIDYEGIIGLQDHQLNDLIRTSSLHLNIPEAKQLNQAVTVAEEGSHTNASQTGAAVPPKSTDSLPAQSPPKYWPLVNLFRYLHEFCLFYRLEILRFQAEFLYKTRWRDHIVVHYSDGPSKTLSVRYWCKSVSYSLNGSGTKTTYSSDNNSKTNKVGHFLQLSVEPSPLAPSYDLSDLPLPPGIDIAVARSFTRGLSCGDPDGSSSASTLSTPLVLRSSCFQAAFDGKSIGGSGGEKPVGPRTPLMDWTTHSPSTSLRPSSPTLVSLNVVNPMLDIERLLITVACVEARNKMRNITERLKAFRIVESEASSTAALTQDNSGVLTFPTNPAIVVEYRPSRRVRISVDVQSGLVRVTAAAMAVMEKMDVVEGVDNRSVVVEGPSNEGFTSSASTSNQSSTDASDKGIGGISVPIRPSLGEKLGMVENRLNQDISGCSDALMYLRQSSVLDEVESFGRFLGLTAVRLFSLDRSDAAKFGSPPPEHMIYLQGPGFGDHFIVIAVGEEKRFLGTAARLVSADAIPGIESLRGEPSCMVWIASSRSRPNVSTLSLDNVYPVSVDILNNVVPAWHSPKKLLWEPIDLEMLQVIVSSCRDRIAWSLLSTQLRRASIPFSYVQSGKLVPDTADPIDATSSGIMLGYPLCVSPLAVFDSIRHVELDNSSSYYPKPGPSNLSTVQPIMKMVEVFPFGDFYLTVQKVEPSLPLTTEAPFSTSATSSFGTESLTWFVGRVRLRLSRLPPVTIDEKEDQDQVLYDPVLGVLILSSVKVVALIESVLGRWRRMAAVAQLASAIFMRQQWLNDAGWKIKTYSLDYIELSSERFSCGSIRFSRQKTLGLPVETFVVTMGHDEKSDVERLRPHVEALINTAFDIVIVIKVLSRCLAILNLMTKIKDECNVPEMLSRPGDTLVKIEVLSLKVLRLHYGSHAIDFELVSNDQVMICDASQIHQTGHGRNKSHYSRPSVLPIPFFSSDTSDTADSTPNNTKGSFIAGLSVVLDDSKCPDDAKIVTVPGGCLVSDSLVPLVISRARRFLETFALMDFISEYGKSKYNIPPTIQSNKTQHLLMFLVPPLLCGWRISSDQTWRLGLAFPGNSNQPALDTNNPSNFRVSRDNLNKLALFMTEKFQDISYQIPNVRPFLKSFVDFWFLPQAVMNDFSQICNPDKLPQVKLRPEWCFIMPQHSESHLPPPGSPAVILNQKETRLCLVLKFVSLSTNATRILPIRYNYATNIIWVWRADESDITSLPLGPFLTERLQEMENESSSYTDLDKAFLRGSAKEVSIEKGGPGKLFIVVKHLCHNTHILGLE